MQYTNTQKNVTNTPRKLRLVADMVRRMMPEQAMETLQFTNKSAARPLYKAIKTAVANAGAKEGLRFAKIEINDGPKLRRFRAGSRGRANPLIRRSSQIKIVLTDEAEGGG